MAVYKDDKQKTWYVSVRYTNWQGEKTRKVKRGFKTKREAQEWEQSFINENAGSLEMTFLESNSNDRKHRWRMENMYDYFSYEDGDMERFHPETAYNPVLFNEYEDLYSAIASLPGIQRRRVLKKFFEDMTCKEIGDSEGVTEAAISTSLKYAMENLKKIMSEA